MNCIFTIVAKNYLAMALTLGDSIKAVHPNYDFFIILADAVDDEFELIEERYRIIEVGSLGINNWLDLAFKYDISEFSTSIKPFCFEYFMAGSKYQNIMYFDPDIYIFNELTQIENLLEDNFCVVTPHHSDLEIEWSGALPENNILISGIYNLGFIAFKNSENSKFVIHWWKEKLRDKCYIERSDGLFYDQNWIQFLISSFDKGIYILRDYGYNIAWWNLHERSIEFCGDIPHVVHKKSQVSFECIFFHFSGFNVLDLTVINSRYRNNPFLCWHINQLCKGYSLNMLNL
ncbi:MAG: glycosyl transferase [Holophaga sp.]|nr:glycosyl transferase [Holophaga sp.]